MMRPIGALTAMLLIAVTACGGDDGSTATSPTPAPTTAEPTTEPPRTTPPEPGELVLVYFLRGEQLVVGGRVATRAEPRAALQGLLDGPNLGEAELGWTSSIPEGTELLGVTVDGGRATVDLSEEFASGGGTLSMTTRAAQVVFTVTQFSGVEMVDFEIDGEPIAALGGEGLVVDDVDRLTFESVLPLILVEGPVPGQRVEREFTMSGMSNTIEATVEWALRTEDGSELASGFGTATSGSGTWGTFEVPVEVPAGAPEHFVLQVFDSSPVDGSRENLVEVPLLFLG